MLLCLLFSCSKLFRYLVIAEKNVDMLFYHLGFDFQIIYNTSSHALGIGTGPYDLALVKLQQPINTRNPGNIFLKPCQYFSTRRKNYHFGTLIGLGLTNQNPIEPSQQLMEVQLKRDRSCGKHYSIGNNIIPSLQVCYSNPGRADVNKSVILLTLRAIPVRVLLLFRL